MNDAQLRCFHYAAEEQSITRAAQRLNISQPTVSSQIKALEKGYGVQLFMREARGIELTPLGASLFEITTRIYDAQDDAKELLSEQNTVAGGHLRLGTVAPHHLMPVLGELRRHHPDITYSLTVGNSATIQEAMRRHEIDIGILASLRLGDPTLHAQLLRRDDMVILVHRDHRLAECRAIAFSELAGETILIREKGSATRQMFLDAAGEHAEAFGTVVEMASRETIKEAVACNLGVAPVLASEAGQDLRCVSLRLPPGCRLDEYVACAVTTRRSPIVRAFLGAATTVAAQLEKAALKAGI
ncbi:LysR family transcriptional regulator [Cereibacter changlensis]|uniref:LysR family transcriptional regulator n=1 Tax=Cereibacter changlensis TaxID=402884 RepID=A0A4U0YTV0_9RHOB|nr:LysR substrate-binding domain-containing protein [Cereibacter changlensis]TKA96142.1 LysR family transcriptional regulator [Cereibacter changlensis]